MLPLVLVVSGFLLDAQYNDVSMMWDSVSNSTQITWASWDYGQPDLSTGHCAVLGTPQWLTAACQLPTNVVCTTKAGSTTFYI